MVDIDTRHGRRPGNEPCPHCLVYRDPDAGLQYYPLDKNGRLVSPKPAANPHQKEHKENEITILDTTVSETGIDPKAHALGQISDTDTEFDWPVGEDDQDESYFSVDPYTKYFE